MKPSKLQCSTALFALGSFILVNMLLAAANGNSALSRFKPVADQGILFQSCNSAVTEYKSPPPPNVVLMGSSVLAAPVWSVDAHYISNTPDLYHHHRCYFMERNLEHSGKACGAAGCGVANHGMHDNKGRRVKVVCMAIPGAMVSDQFLLVDKILLQQRGTAMPTLVVALCPRDFMDDLLTGETRTAVFQSLACPEDLPALGDLYFSSATEKADFLFSNAVFLYGKRWRYQQKFNSYLDYSVPVLRGFLLAKVREHRSITKNAEDAKRLEPGVAGRTQKAHGAPHTCFGQILTAGDDAQAKANRFLLEKDRVQVWKQSLEEYRARYKHFNSVQFAKQVKFLDRLLNTAAQRNIKIILVNMPLTQDNIALMPPVLYKNYIDCVSILAGRYEVRFINCQHDPYYVPSVFYDTVHLNEHGGEHFLNALSNVIILEDEQLASLKHHQI